MMIRMNRWVLIALCLTSSEAFGGFAPIGRSTVTTTTSTSTTSTTTTTTTTALSMGMSRKARRQMQQEQKTKVGRDKQFRDMIDGDDDDDDTDTNNGDKTVKKAPVENEVEEEMQRRMENRPAVSNLYVDDETGMEIIQQGRFVMDVITRQAIVLNPSPNIRMAQMFPGIPMDVRDKHRFDWTTVEVPEMITKLQTACSLPNGDLPPFPSITNTGIDFVLANRDLLGHRMSKTLGKLMMRAAWKEDKEQMQVYRNLLRNFLTIENYISAPFRQIIMDSELAIGPNFGNLNIEAYIGNDLFERSSAYLVLKGMQCTWEKKVRDAEVIENTVQTEDNYYKILATGDPRRYHPEPEVIWESKECQRVCAMGIQMVKTFVNDETYFADLPVECRFIEAALTIQGGAALRAFITDDFCPREQITPAALREGMRRLLAQLDSMYLDPYADIRNVVDKLQKAMTVGSGDDERNPYEPYLQSLSVDSPAYFQTYTFNHNPMSLVRFLDAKKFEPNKQNTAASSETNENPFAAVSYIPYYDDVMCDVCRKKQTCLLTLILYLITIYLYTTALQRLWWKQQTQESGSRTT